QGQRVPRESQNALVHFSALGKRLRYIALASRPCLKWRGQLFCPGAGGNLPKDKNEQDTKEGKYYPVQLESVHRNYDLRLFTVKLFAYASRSPLGSNIFPSNNVSLSLLRPLCSYPISFIASSYISVRITCLLIES